ncbi:MAG: class I SAM-dependent methyltransferase [Holosporales bacterium]|nr:class I SAM-dependent methyltransferase [Holosporales bacterium]
MNNPQKEHFEKIHDLYTTHYHDATSARFREEFVYEPLFKGMDLNGKDVLECASGGGANTLALLKRFPKARFCGCDISEAACSDYRAETGCPAFWVDLTLPIAHDKLYDVVMVFGGIHHCARNLPVVLDNIYKLLKPDGLFLMFEPNNQFFLEKLRKFWYRHDSFFESETEEALDHDDLLHMANSEGGESKFKAEMVQYLFGPAAFFVANSMIFRIPLWLKPIITPPLMLFERIYNGLSGKCLYTNFLACWRKLP